MIELQKLIDFLRWRKSACLSETDPTEFELLAWDAGMDPLEYKGHKLGTNKYG